MFNIPIIYRNEFNTHKLIDNMMYWHMIIIILLCRVDFDVRQWLYDVRIF